jgi:hypothetical protein
MNAKLQARLKRIVRICPKCGIVVALRYRGEKCAVASCPKTTILVRTRQGKIPIELKLTGTEHER